MVDLPQEIIEHYALTRTLPDGRIIGIKRLLLHWTLHVGIDVDGYAENYCFATEALVYAAFRDWNGVGDPEGWHRHPKTGRRRDLATGREWIAF